MWTIVGLHASLLVVEAIETIGMAIMFFIAPIEDKNFSDASDDAFYWYFLVGSWVVLYVIVYLAPRWM